MQVDLDRFGSFELGGWSRRGKGDDYESHFTALTKAFAGVLLNRLGVGPDTRLLDVGTGTGTVAAMAGLRGATAVGADFSAEMIGAARRLHPDLEFVVAEVDRLPFAPASFDTVIANFLFQHLPQPEAALVSIRRLLRSGGRVGLTNWVFSHRPAPSPQTIFMAAVSDAGVRSTADLPPGPDLDRFDDPAALREMLEGTGYDDIHCEEISLPVSLSVDEVWDSMTLGAVRVAALVEGLDQGSRELVRQALEARMATQANLSLIATVIIAARI